MKQLTIEPTLFTRETPKSAGLFLWKTNTIELISVVWYSAKHEHGIYWDGYFGVPSLRGRNVSQLQGEFLEVIV